MPAPLLLGQRRTKAEVLKTLPELAVTRYTLDEPRVVALAPEAVLLTYRLTRQSSFKGQELPPSCDASSVWVRRGDRWLIAFYQETPLAR